MMLPAMGPIYGSEVTFAIIDKGQILTKPLYDNAFHGKFCGYRPGHRSQRSYHRRGVGTASAGVTAGKENPRTGNIPVDIS